MKEQTMFDYETNLSQAISKKLIEQEATNAEICIKTMYPKANKEGEERLYAIVDLKYTWQLNATEHTADHQDVPFVLTESGWLSPVFYMQPLDAQGLLYQSERDEEREN